MTNFKLKSTLAGTLALIIFFLTTNTMLAQQNVTDISKGINIKASSNDTLAGLNFYNTQNALLGKIDAINQGINITSQAPSVSNLSFYNNQNDLLGTFQFRKYGADNYQSGLVNNNGQYYVMHQTGSKTIFSVGGTAKMVIFNNGQISIGDTRMRFKGFNTANAQIGADQYKLFVETGILTEKVKVAGLETDDWADYVFEEDYEMLPLGELESYVKENKHLPNVPSAQEVADNGLDLAKTDATLLEKIEESYLYIIELNKKFEALAAENNNLKSDMKALQTSQN